MFVVGSGVDVSSVKAHLENLVSCPSVRPTNPKSRWPVAPALASANAPAFEATTVGLAYSQDPDGTTAGNAYAALAAADTQLAPVGSADELVDDYAAQTDMEPIAAEEGRKPFLLVGSALTSIFVVGVVALVISLAVSIRPTVDQRPSPGPNAIVPSTAAPAPAPVQEAQQPVAPAPPPPPAETIKPPVPVAVQEAPAPQQAPRQVFVEQAPAPQAPAPAPAPAAPPPAPEAPPPAPLPWRRRRSRISRLRCTTRRCTTRTCRRPFTTRGPSRGSRRGSSRRSRNNRKSRRTAQPDRTRRRARSGRRPGGGSGSGGSGDYEPGGSGGSRGSGGSGGSGRSGGGSGGCFLIFCAAGPASLAALTTTRYLPLVWR